MRTLKYIGKKSLDLGRFSNLNNGDCIHATENEYAGIKDDPRFEDLTEYPTKSEVEALKKIKPVGTPFYDLRTIEWGHRYLFRKMESRSGILELNKIVKAFRHIGLPCSEVNPHTHRRDVVDTLVYYARQCGWGDISNDERRALPIVAEPFVEAELSEVAKPKTTKKKVTRKSDKKPKAKKEVVAEEKAVDEAPKKEAKAEAKSRRSRTEG